MKKVYLFLLIGIFLIQPILAVSLNVQKLSDKEVMISGLNEPAVFSLNVTNNGRSDNFSFYTFFGNGINPSVPVAINSGETKEVDLEISPRVDSKLKGYVVFNYYIQGSDKSEVTQNLTTNILDLQDAFKIGSDSIDPESNSVNLYLQNKVNFGFKNLSVHFNSPFFDFEKTINLGPYQKQSFTVNLNKEDFAKLIAGFYTVNVDLNVQSVSAQISEPIDFVEKSIVNEERKQYGFIISTTAIKKINSGNVVADSEVTVSKNIISRIFTTFSEEPTIVKRSGLTVNYFWEKRLNPGDTYEVDVITNWLIPFIVVVLVVLIVVFVKKYSKTDLVLRKRVSFINAKGGEFGLRVTVNVEARKFIENVRVFDRLPPLVKVYEKFEGVVPNRFNKTRRVFEWDLGNLDTGERRTFSYVIYSRVGVLGKFVLPETTAIFEREGKQKEVSSNKAFFLASERREI